ncbi:hypothetical protein [Vreelandella sp. H-I2]
MDKAAQLRLSEVLKGVTPTELCNLKTTEFTRQLAEASGYTLDWSQFDKSPAGRDVLYIARDLSVNKLALPNIQNLVTKRDVMLSMDQLEGNRELPDLLRDAVRPF